MFAFVFILVQCALSVGELMSGEVVGKGNECLTELLEILEDRQGTPQTLGKPCLHSQPASQLLLPLWWPSGLPCSNL